MPDHCVVVHTHDFEVNDVDDWEKLGHSVHWGPIPKLYNGFSGDRFTHRERTVEVKVEQRSLCYYVAFAIEVYSSFESLTCGHSVAKYPRQSIAGKWRTIGFSPQHGWGGKLEVEMKDIVNLFLFCILLEELYQTTSTVVVMKLCRLEKSVRRLPMNVRKYCLPY